MFKTILQKIVVLKNWFTSASWKTKLVVLGIIVAILWLAKPLVFGGRRREPQYQTAPAEKGTLISSLSASGMIVSGSRVSITTNASGIVNNVYVKIGESVVQGAKIADMTLDTNAQQRQAAAWASYLSAQNTLEAGSANAYSLRSAKDTAWKKFYNLAVDAAYQNADGSPKEDIRNSSADFQSAQADWFAAEAKYKNQQAVIAQAQAALTSAWLSYTQLSSTITAPASGTIVSLTLSPGTPVAGSPAADSSSATAIGTIVIKEKSIQAIVNLTEIDAPKVAVDQKVTLTLDAFPGKSFTGSVSAINTNGVVSSGVTTYPVTITFDTAPDTVYPNMSVSAAIVTSIKNDVIIVPSAAVQTANGQSTVRILKNRQVTSVPVEVGTANDTQTEIVSGITEGDVVVTGVVNSANTRTGGQTTSPFGGRGFGAGAFRVGGGGSGGGRGDQH